MTTDLLRDIRRCVVGADDLRKAHAGAIPFNSVADADWWRVLDHLGIAADMVAAIAEMEAFTNPPKMAPPAFGYPEGD